MNYYIILLLLFFLITILWKFFSHKDVSSDKKYLIVVFTLLVLFLVLKSQDVGIDNGNYKKIFEYCHNLGFFELFKYGRHEIGYKIYNKIISSIYYNFSFLLIVTSILSMIGVYFFMKNNSKNYIYTILIFITFNFYGYFFGIYRQVLAISILLFSIKYIKEKKLVLFLISVFIASLFHKTALIFIPIYFISNIKITKKILFLWSSLIIIFLGFKDFIISFILNYIYKPADVIGIGGEGYKMLILMIMLSFVSYHYQDKLIKQDKNNQIFINMIYVGTIIQCLSTAFGNIYRLTLYFSIAIIILIPNIIKCIENKKLRSLIVILMFTSLTLYFYYNTRNLINYSPYSFIF